MLDAVTKICLWNETFDKEENKCVKKPPRLAAIVPADQRCLEGKYYTLKYNRRSKADRKKRGYKQCAKIRNKDPRCKVCKTMKST
jgi:hypothetical protein